MWKQTRVKIFFAHTRIQKSGGFTITEIPLGFYQLSVVDDHGYPVELTPNSNTIVDPQDAPELTHKLEVVKKFDKNADVQPAAARMLGSLTLSGTVTSAHTDEPLESIHVALYNGNRNYVDGFLTDFSGTYSFTGLEAGTYYLGFSPNTEETNSDYLEQYYNQQNSLWKATPINLTANQEINAALTVGSFISGKVLKADDPSSGLESVEVSVYDALGRFVKQNQTDSSGYYEVGPLPSGDYRLYFNTLWGEGDAPDYVSQYYHNASALKTATPITVSAPRGAHDIDEQLSLGGKISGKITAGETNGYDIQIYKADECNYYRRYFRNKSVDYNGPESAYTIRGLASGSYYLKFSGEYIYDEETDEFIPGPYMDQYYNNQQSLWNAAPVVVTGTATTSDINATLALGGSIQGTITDQSGSPVSGVWVGAYNTYGSLVGSSYTNGYGKYTTGSLPSGNYKVVMDSENYIFQYYPNAPLFTDAGNVTVSAGAVTSNIDAALVNKYNRNASIKGHVSLVYGEETESAHEADIIVYDQYKNVFDTAVTDYGGNYSIALPAGDYFLKFIHSNFGTQYYHNVSSLSDAQKITLADGQELTLNDVTLKRGHHFGLSTVDASTGAALWWGSAQIFDSNNQIIGQASNGYDWIFDTELPAGSYRVKISANNETLNCVERRYKTIYWNDQLRLSSATSITLPQDDDTIAMSGMQLDDMPAFVIQPLFATAGDKSVTLMVRGKEFAKGMKVVFNGKSLSTTLVNANLLKATVPAKYLKTAGVVEVWVTARGGKSSASELFTIYSKNAAAAAPVLSKVSSIKTKASEISVPQAITLSGKNFTSNSVVYLDGEPIQTAFVNAKMLKAVVFPVYLTGGSHLITVYTRDGGFSSAKKLTINNSKPVLTSLSQTTAPAAGSDFVLTLNGSNFIQAGYGKPGSVVMWKGKAVKTFFVTPNELAIEVTTAMLKRGTVTIKVVNPGTGGGSSKTLKLKVQ